MSKESTGVGRKVETKSQSHTPQVPGLKSPKLQAKASSLFPLTFSSISNLQPHHDRLLLHQQLRFQLTPVQNLRLIFRRDIKIPHHSGQDQSQFRQRYFLADATPRTHAKVLSRGLMVIDDFSRARRSGKPALGDKLFRLGEVGRIEIQRPG